MFEDIRSPAKVQNEIYHQMEATRTAASTSWATASPRQRPAAAARRRRPATVPTRSTSCTSSASRAHLTEAEFEAKKAELLNRM